MSSGNIKKSDLRAKNLKRASSPGKVSHELRSIDRKVIQVDYDPGDPNGPGLNAPYGTLAVSSPNSVAPNGDGRVDNFYRSRLYLKTTEDPLNPSGWVLIDPKNFAVNTTVANRMVLLNHTAVGFPGLFASFIGLNRLSPTQVYGDKTGVGNATQVFRVKVTALGIQKPDTGSANPEGTPEEDTYCLSNEFFVRYRPASLGPPLVTVNPILNTSITEIGLTVDGVLATPPPSLNALGIVFNNAIPLVGFFITNGDDNGGGDSGRTILWQIHHEVTVSRYTDETLTQLDYT